MPNLTIEATVESWPIAGAFVIARGAKREANVVVAQVSDGRSPGRGECVPYARYGETVEGVRDAILAIAARCTTAPCCGRCRPAPPATRSTARCGTTRPSAPARSAAGAAGIAAPRPVDHRLHHQPRHARGHGRKAPPRRAPCRSSSSSSAARATRARLRQVRAACPAARLIADANEAWTPELLPSLMAGCGRGRRRADRAAAARRRGCGARGPAPGARVRRRVACTTAPASTALAGRYDAVNIKLDKAGGLTEALALAARRARAAFKIMVGCMVATSLVDGAGACSSPRAPTGSTSTARCCWPGTANPRLRYEGALVHPPEPAALGLMQAQLGAAKGDVCPTAG